jgi:hypothetical protein
MPGIDDIYKRLPVRSTYNGFYQDASGNKKDYAITNDYHEFYTYVQNKNAFNVFFYLNFYGKVFIKLKLMYEIFFSKTPSGVFCKNRKATKSPPEIKYQFGFNQEIVTETGAVQYLKVFDFEIM